MTIAWIISRLSANRITPLRRHKKLMRQSGRKRRFATGPLSGILDFLLHRPDPTIDKTTNHLGLGYVQCVGKLPNPSLLVGSVGHLKIGAVPPHHCHDAESTLTTQWLSSSVSGVARRGRPQRKGIPCSTTGKFESLVMEASPFNFPKLTLPSPGESSIAMVAVFGWVTLT